MIGISSKKNSNSKIIYNPRKENLFCDKCGCKLNKNRKTKNGVQKYICYSCTSTYSETSNSIIYRSKLSFEVWSNIIDNLLDGSSIRRITEENNIPIYTFFRIRHKTLLALKLFVKKIKLNGQTQSDEKYFSINLKGTKPKDMPRYSKKRTSSAYRGISHHKVCVISTIDEHDNLALEIAGLGRCTKIFLVNVLD